MPSTGRKRLEWSSRALRDMTEIADFYGEFSGATANRVISSIIRRASALEENPEAGPLAVLGLRRLVLTTYPFTIYYRVRPRSVQVVRVVHQRMRFPD